MCTTRAIAGVALALLGISMAAVAPVPRLLAIWMGCVYVSMLVWGLFDMPDRAERRRAPGQCGNCGYDLTGNESGRCPECGQRTRALQ